MESLFNENTIFSFAMIAIYNYSDLKEYQRMGIIKTKKECDKYGRKNTSF